jgi:hypothetical protein
MTRSLKALGLAMVAMLALGAVLASAASAAPKLTSASNEYPVVLEGSQSTKHKFTLPGNRTFECTTVKFVGEIKSKAEAETSKATVAPTYEGCTATILGNIDPVTVTLNGCTYQLSLTEEAASAGYEYAGAVKIQCPAGKSIEVHVWENTTKHTNNEATLCTYSIGEQGPLTKIDYKLNEKNANGEATTGNINATVANIATTRVSGTLTNCGAASQVATYEGDTLVEGFHNGEMIKGIIDPK